MSKTEAELIQLRAENDALKALLAQHGTRYRNHQIPTLAMLRCNPMPTSFRPRRRLSSSDDSFVGGTISIQFAG